MTKKEEAPITPEAPAVQPAPVVQAPQEDSSLGVASMILGVVSLTGFGFLLGIPAIILGAIGLKKNPASKGLSLAGLITGIISTVISLIVVAFVVFAIVWGASHPSEFKDYDKHGPEAEQQLFEGLKT